MHRYFCFLLLLFPLCLFGQLTESSLPIIIINTVDGLEVLDEPKTNATIRILYNEDGSSNSLSDQQTHYMGNIGIEIRGESSQSFPKKAYLFETRDENNEDINASFLGFPSEEDFILYAPYSDKTLLNNVLAMKLANEMGRYASRTRHVELILNGEYQGVYVLMEKIKRDKNRVDISKLKTTDIEGDQLTGGYIIRIDKGSFDGWTSKHKTYGQIFDLYYQFFYPEGPDIQPLQRVYIQSYLDGFEDALDSQDYTNSIDKHYSEYINLRSFYDNFILNEFSKNVDAYRLSSYFHKDRDSKGGKLVAGPVWDYNLSFGNADYCDGDNLEGWMIYQCGGSSPFWWDRMLKDNFFINGLRCRYEDLREEILSKESISEWISQSALELDEPAKRNFERWQILGSYVWPNPERYSQPTSYSEIIEGMKDFVDKRIDWMDSNMYGQAIGCELYEELEKSNSEIEGDDLLIPSAYVYPNPGNSYFNLAGSDYITEVKLYNLFGTCLDVQQSRDGIFHFKIGDDIISGTYVLSAKVGDTLVRKKVIVQR